MYDFSQNVVPGQGERERGYWRDVGTLDAYFDANMDLIAPLPVFNLYNAHWPVFSHHPPLPPAKISESLEAGVSRLSSSMLCQGAIVASGQVERSIIGPGAFVDKRARVEESVIFDGVHIGADARIRRCIIDKNVVVPPGLVIGHDPDADAQRFTVSEGGVVVIEKGRDLSDCL